MKKFLRSRIFSFYNAFRGIATIFRSEINFVIQSAIALLVLAAGILLGITPTEWIIIILLIGMVLGAEAFNTAIERLCDAIDDQPSPKIRFIKDASAAAVLILSLSAAVIGILIFWKYLAALLLNS
jgi:diacylglycerol kinase (ATP)